MDLQAKMGIKIKGLRENKQLSQTQLAEIVGYKDKTAIAKVEAGKVDLPQSKILAISKALDVTPADLLDVDVDAEIDVIPMVDIAEYEFNRRILRYCQLLNGKGKAEAVKRIEELTYIPDYSEQEKSLLNAAHELPSASKKDKKHDNDIMDNDNEWE